MNESYIKRIKPELKSSETTSVLVFSPGRINLIGEHTDYNEGYALPAAIDKGIYLGIKKNNKNYSTFKALDFSDEYRLKFNEIAPLKEDNWKNYVLGVVADLLEKGFQLENFEVVFGGDIPIGSGLSSSAALENAIVFALNELFELGIPKEEMILISQKSEHNYVGVKCGIMDQYTSMFGKKSHLLLLDCRTITSQKISIQLDDYEILLMNTNVAHKLSDSAYNQRRATCQKIADLLKKPSLRDIQLEEITSLKDEIAENELQKAIYVIKENERVLDMVGALASGDLKKCGELLYASHEGLSQNYQVSCEELDYLVNQSKKYPEILGARMMGGGFGGNTINIVKKGSDEIIEKILSDYENEFSITPSLYKVNINDGTKRID